MDTKFYRNTKTEKHMGTGGGPHGTTVGLMKCVSRTEVHESDRVFLVFEAVAPLVGTMEVTVPKGTAEGIVVDGVWQVYLQTP